MCIRDSPKEAMKIFEPFLGRYYKDKWQTQGRSFGIELTYVCLLYTSDAADDLLCVDFGGRRFIKKKTTTIKIKGFNTLNVFTGLFDTTLQRCENF